MEPRWRTVGRVLTVFVLLVGITIACWFLPIDKVLDASPDLHSRFKMFCWCSMQCFINAYKNDDVLYNACKNDDMILQDVALEDRSMSRVDEKT